MKERKPYEHRKPELEQYRSVWITKSEYLLLREQKKKQGISMAKIVCNLIIEKYETPNT